MPEGPEVETIKRGLEVGIVGQTIGSLQVLWPGSLKAPLEVAKPLIEQAKVMHVNRRAKVLLIELDRGYSLMFHLKMTGQIVLVKVDGERYAGGHPSLSMRESLPDSSTRLIFEFESGDRLFFNDQRKFGWIKLVPTDEVRHDPLIARLGPEADSVEFTVTYLQSQLTRHARAPVKAVILDQSTVSGVGNIYADESLHLARIHPARLSGALKPGEVKRLQAAIRDVLATGILHGGTSFAHYVNSLGGTGDYLEHARVFRREGQSCPVHPETQIVKLRVAGRGTHICPKCQKLPKI